MESRFTHDVDRSCPLGEYPRPQLVREPWQCLNGVWKYAISKSSRPTEKWDGEILVPFSPETLLSGVGRSPERDEYLWYGRDVQVPESFEGRRVILHFDAVDCECEVFVNGKTAVCHTGGYLPFETDITELISCGRAEILVRVRDETDFSCHSRGKQKTDRGGIWYTPQSGIWQSVWMEAVPEEYIRELRITPLFDEGCVAIEGDAEQVVFEGKTYDAPCRIYGDFESWTPDNPKLYPFTAVRGEDRVESYFAMRKISVDTDEKGRKLLFLNNEPLFQNGLLDQGYWPDGLYTPPTDEAMVFDIQTAKDMGFNMLRKHIKVEPLRWYYHCDRLGMLVWQDMPSGGGKYKFPVISFPLFTNIHLNDGNYSLFAREDENGRNEYHEELAGMVRHLYNSPCIVLWVPFNEGWGQFDAKVAYELIENIDGTRLIDHASGWHDQWIGEIKSWHVYFKPYVFSKDRLNRAVVLSEYGGYSYRVEGHIFNDKLYGYKTLKDAPALEKALGRLFGGEIAPAREKGLAAAVYTQLTDVEDELNGLITYDRKELKLPSEIVHRLVKNLLS